jgi:acyl dehydratase
MPWKGCGRSWKNGNPVFRENKMEFELGKTYDQLEIGDEASFTKTITETDVYLFAGISGDFNPMHVNEAFAKQTPFKTRIAHGALPQSLIAPVLGMKLPGLGTILVEISCRFKAPTLFGDTITATARVSEKLAEKKWIRMALVWKNQEGKLIAEGETVVIPPPSDVKELLSKQHKPAHEEPKTKKEEKIMAISSVKEVFDGMPEAFNATAAQGLNVVFQFEITGDGGGNWSVTIKDGTCEVTEGSHDAPTTTLTMSGETWLAMVNRELDGMQAFMSGQLKVSGDIMLANRISELFPS